MSIKIYKRVVQPGWYRLYETEEENAHWILVNAQDLLDIMDWCLRNAEQLRAEAGKSEPPKEVPGTK